MSKGILLPFQKNIRGGIQTVEGSEMLRQVIMLAVRPASSNHPWNQNLTPREDIIFDIAESAIGGELSAFIYDLFEELERLNMASISKGGGVRVRPIVDNTGDVEVVITYTDLEDMRSREVRFRGAK